MPLTKNLQLSPTDAAYIAGIVDGEGSISLVKSHAKRTRGRYVYPLVRIANTDLLLLEWISAKVGMDRRIYTSRLGDKFKWVYHVSWASSDAVTLLRAILPYLVIKKVRAEIVLELHRVNEDARAAAGGYFGNYHPVPDWLMEKREAAFDTMILLNKRGLNESIN